MQYSKELKQDKSVVDFPYFLDLGRVLRIVGYCLSTFSYHFVSPIPEINIPRLSYLFSSAPRIRKYSPCNRLHQHHTGQIYQEISRDVFYRSCNVVGSKREYLSYKLSQRAHGVGNCDIFQKGILLIIALWTVDRQHMHCTSAVFMTTTPLKCSFPISYCCTVPGICQSPGRPRFIFHAVAHFEHTQFPIVCTRWAFPAQNSCNIS